MAWSPPFVLSRNQSERILAASPIQLNQGAVQVLNITADQDCLVDLSRLCISAGVINYNGGPPNTSPTQDNLSALIQCTSVLIKQTTELVRGQAAPGGLIGFPIGVYSPYRKYTPFRLTGAGDWLALSSQESIQITVQDTGAFGGNYTALVVAAVPTVLFCDRGITAYPHGFNQNDAAAILGAQTVNNQQVNPTPIGINGAQFLMVQQAAETGLADISQVQIQLASNANNPQPASAQNMTPVKQYTGVLNQVTRVDRSLLVQGVDTSGFGAGVAAPLGMITAPQVSSRANPWVRFQAVEMGNGNAITWQVTAFDADANPPTNYGGTLACPWYPSGRSKPPLGCI